MARMRTLKPEAFTSLSLSDVDRGIRWTFGGLWTYCDDDGRGVYEPRLIKAALYPVDDAITRDVIEADIVELVRVGAVCRYTVDGAEYLHVPAWKGHQHPNRPQYSKLPPCPVHGGSRSTDSDTDSQRTEPSLNGHAQDTAVLASSSNGLVEERPQAALTNPKFCEDHQPDGTAEDCGKCARLRIRDQRQQSERERRASDKNARLAKQRADCTKCDDGGMLTNDDGSVSHCLAHLRSVS